MVWTSIPAGDIDVDSPLTTALITALRDNFQGMGERGTGAPKMFGVVYDYQEILVTGNWVKPSNAATGDRVIVHVVGGGGSGDRDTGFPNGGGGGGGLIFEIADIDDLAATVACVIGAGGAGRSTNVEGEDGGLTSFAAGTRHAVEGLGGQRGRTATLANGGDVNFGDKSHIEIVFNEAEVAGNTFVMRGGDGDIQSGKLNSIFGGGGGSRGQGGSGDSNINGGGFSRWAGWGGYGNNADRTPYPLDGAFPAGGGGGSHTGGTQAVDSGAGGDGVVRVWCIKDK